MWLGRRFTWNVKTYLLWKVYIRIFQNVVCCSCDCALRANIIRHNTFSFACGNVSYLDTACMFQSSIQPQKEINVRTGKHHHLIIIALVVSSSSSSSSALAAASHYASNYRLATFLSIILVLKKKKKKKTSLLAVSRMQRLSQGLYYKSGYQPFAI